VNWRGELQVDRKLENERPELIFSTKKKLFLKLTSALKCFSGSRTASEVVRSADYGLSEWGTLGEKNFSTQSDHIK
jgi:hypothetical protein